MASSIDTLFNGGAESQAADKNRALYTDYLKNGFTDLATGHDKATDWLSNALQSYAPLSDLAKKYTSGTDMYLDALGLNGQSGADAATAAFQKGPGYDFTLNSGLDAINRRRASAGMLDSGNADQDATKFATGLADQTYGSWLDRLSGINNNAISTTGAVSGAQAGVYGSLADLEQQYNADRIGLRGNAASGMASANNTEAAGKAAGAKNLLGAGMSLASLALGGVGGAGMGSAIPGAVGPTSVGGAPLSGGTGLGKVLSWFGG
ncbi:hypothetical protein [Rhodopseudomonas sp. B29]|uniref:hypothetical protein n=1 Tax=Rhodopseudomonas sp. B29 TaxID=95607 RepID=UPI0003462559|nr:hypothetical protein [Rhodopseudomonas sp. B29]